MKEKELFEMVKEEGEKVSPKDVDPRAFVCCICKEGPFNKKNDEMVFLTTQNDDVYCFECYNLMNK